MASEADGPAGYSACNVENLDLVRSIYADWKRGDFTRRDWAHPEIEYVIPDGPEPGTWTGLAAVADALHDELRAWDDFRFWPEEYRELDADRVLVIGHHSGAARQVESRSGRCKRR